jgi:predicted DsbA family dithiol-disulfide isomerase
MKVDIWSDIRCPFCYIGKRRFEEALSRFEHKDKIEVIWHSFELDPYMKTQPQKNPLEYLAEIKGQSLEWSEQMHEQVTATAASVGLDFKFSQSVVANSFDAHRLIQFAKTKGLGDQAKERLLRAYFTEGVDISSHESLMDMGVQVGLDRDELKKVLSSDAYTENVRNDEATAQRLGIRGVPFFVLDQKYGVSGAQMPETFLDALQQAWKEQERIDTVNNVVSKEGSDACDINGNC